MRQEQQRAGHEETYLDHALLSLRCAGGQAS
jgi:hypothetical protein